MWGCLAPSSWSWPLSPVDVVFTGLDELHRAEVEVDAWVGHWGYGGLCTTTKVWHSSKKRHWREQKSLSCLDSHYSQTSVSLHVPFLHFEPYFKHYHYSLTTVHISSFCPLPGWVWTHKSLRCDTLLSGLLILCPHAVCLLWLSLWFSHLTLESQSNKRQRGKISTKGGGVGTKVKK